MATCSICGGRYDERAYQIVVRGLRASFDGVECAQIAMRRDRRRLITQGRELVPPISHEPLALPPAGATGEPRTAEAT